MQNETVKIEVVYYTFLLVAGYLAIGSREHSKRFHGSEESIADAQRYRGRYTSCENYILGYGHSPGPRAILMRSKAPSSVGPDPARKSDGI